MGSDDRRNIYATHSLRPPDTSFPRPQDAQACAEEAARLRLELQAALKGAVLPLGAEPAGPGGAAATADPSGTRVAELEALVSELQSRLAASDSGRESEPSPSSSLEGELQSALQRASAAEAKAGESDQLLQSALQRVSAAEAQAAESNRILQDLLAASATETAALRSGLALSEAASEEAVARLAASEKAKGELAEALAEAGRQAKEVVAEAGRQTSAASSTVLAASEQRASEAEVRLAQALTAAEQSALEAGTKLAQALATAEQRALEAEAKLARECELGQAVRKDLERAEQTRAELATDLNVANRKLAGMTERIVLMTGNRSYSLVTSWFPTVLRQRSRRSASSS